MNIQTLEHEVKSTIVDILRGGRKRCHETARLLAGHLTELGHSGVRVCDGTAQYRVGFLEEHAEKTYYPDKLIGPEQLNGMIFHDKPSQEDGHFTESVIHSWCELGDIVIDRQSRVPYRNMEFAKITIVKPKDELRGNAHYLKNGKELTLFGQRFVYIPGLMWIVKESGLTVPIPFYLTRIKI